LWFLVDTQALAFRWKNKRATERVMRHHHNMGVIHGRLRERVSDWSDGLHEFLLWCSLIQMPPPARVARVRRAAPAPRKE